MEVLDDQDGAFPVDPLGRLGRAQGKISMAKDFRELSLSGNFRRCEVPAFGIRGGISGGVDFADLRALRIVGEIPVTKAGSG